MYSIKFNNIDIPSFVKIKGVDFQVLPDIKHEFKNTVGAMGLFQAGTTFGSRLFKIKIQIIKGEMSLMEMTRELASWLRGDNFKLSRLEFSEDPGVYYEAKVNGMVNISDLLFLGEGEIEFIVPSGVATSNNLYVPLIDEAHQKIYFEYEGTAPTYPRFLWRPDTTLTNFEFNLSREGSTDTVILKGTFTSATSVVIDCDKKSIGGSGDYGMKNLQVAWSRWIKLPGRGFYTISYNTPLAKEWEVSTPIRWL